MAHSVEVCEINGDSLPDVLGAAYGGHEIAFWQNNGGNPIIWEKHSIDDSYSGPLEVCAADIDNDGDIDVAATAGIGGEVAWWSNEGGYPIQWVKYIIASNFYDAWPLSLADIDSDGDVDVVAGSSSLDEIRFWESSLITSVEGNSKNTVPGQFELFNNFPNPFNPKTTIRYTLPTSDVVLIKVFNVLGKEISTLVNEEKSAGGYRCEWDAGGFPSGVYFYSLTTGDFRETKKMILFK